MNIISLLRSFVTNLNVKNIGFICALLFFVQYVGALKLVTERAVVKYSNPKYITKVEVLTVRRRRQDPYTTNITATVPCAYGSNVTFSFSYTLPSGISVDMNLRLCDVLDKPWMFDFVKMYSNITRCPSPAGTYIWFNVEIPPKNFPLPIPPGLKKGDTGKVYISLYKTKDKERIVELYCTARVA